MSNFKKFEGINELTDTPFITFEKQDEFILGLKDGIEKGEDVLADKSRDMGATWIVLGVFVWFWRFSRKSVQFRVGSRVEDMVDKSGDMDTLFEKMRYLLKKMPVWMLPCGFDWKRHATYMKLYNPQYSSAIIGESTNKNFARGGRQTAVLYDEYPEWEMGEEAWVSASDATKCKIPIGTPKGSGNKFAELARGDEIKRKFHLLWYYHPRKVYTSKEHIESVKNKMIYDKVGRYWVEYKGEGKISGTYIDQFGKIRSEWYDLETQKRSSEDVAQNMDCNYLTSGNAVFDLNIINKKITECEPFEIVGDLNWKIRPIFNDYGDCVNKTLLEVEFIPNHNGIWSFRKHPVKGWKDRYCISCDIAEGLAQGDYNSTSVLDRTDNEVVGTARHKLRTYETAEELAKIGVYFGYAIVAPERNGLGLTVVEQLYRIYPYIYHKDILVKGYPEKTAKMGWETYENTKKVIIGNLGKLISEDGFIDKDEGFWKECLTFVNDDGKLEAESKSRGGKCYDDRVMDRAILLWMTNLLPLPKMSEKKTPLEGWRKRFENKEESLIRFA